MAGSVTVSVIRIEAPIMRLDSVNGLGPVDHVTISSRLACVWNLDAFPIGPEGGDWHVFMKQGKQR